MEKDFSLAWSNFQKLIDSFVKALPNILIGVVVFILFFIFAKFIKHSVYKIFSRKQENLGIVLSRLFYWIVVLFGLFIALTIIVPTFKMGDFIAGLGIGSVAIGFAFKDVLQNFLSGILILLTEPFKVGDEIIVKEGKFEGRVIKIETRATHIVTYDGRLVLIPNAHLYTSSVIVNTAFPKRRSSYEIGIGVDEDIEKAKEIIMSVLPKVPGVLTDPPPDVLTTALDKYTNNLMIRWWGESARADVNEIKSNVLTTVYNALVAADIEIPYPTQTILFDERNSLAVDERVQPK